MGRPSSYTDEMADIICERIAQGEALHRMCDELALPSERTVYRWLEDNEAFRQKYARARDRQADRYAADVVVIADDATDANLARLQIDARKWSASKLAPKKYGDRTTTTVEGGDKPIKTEDSTSPMEQARRVAFLLALGMNSTKET